MFIIPYCVWYPIAPFIDPIAKYYAMDRTFYASNLHKHKNCLWYNNKRRDPVSLEHLDAYNDFVYDEYFLSLEMIERKIKALKDFSVIYTPPNVFDVEKDGNKICIMVTPIDDIKTRVFIFFKQHKNIDNVLIKKTLRYNLRILIET